MLLVGQLSNPSTSLAAVFEAAAVVRPGPRELRESVVVVEPARRLGFAHELTPAHVHVVPQAAPLQLESGPQAEEVLDGEALDATEDVGQAPTRSG